MHVEVPAASPLERRHALAAQNLHVSRLGAGRDLDLDLARRPGNGERRAERRLRHRQVDHRVQVVAVALDAGLRVDADLDEEVARRASELACMALAPNADALPVGDARGDVEVDRALVQRATDAVAGVAGRLDDAAEPLAARAGARADELAEDALGDLLHAAGAAAQVARDGGRAGCGAVAAARLAGLGDARRHADGDPAECLCQRDLDARRHVAAAARPTAAACWPKSDSPKKAPKMSERLPRSKSAGVKPPPRSPSRP